MSLEHVEYLLQSVCSPRLKAHNMTCAWKTFHFTEYNLCVDMGTVQLKRKKQKKTKTHTVTQNTDTHVCKVCSMVLCFSWVIMGPSSTQPDLHI